MRILLVLLGCLTILAGCEKSSTGQALGILERDRITFSATANEIIRELPVKEGTHVTVGQILVQLDNKNQLAVLAQAKAEYAKTNAQLLRLSNGERPEDIAAAQAVLEQADASLIANDKSYRRINKLFQQGLASSAEIERQLANKDIAIAAYHAAKETLAKLTAGARLEDIAAAQAALAATQAQVTLQQQKLDELTIIATRNGILDSLPYNIGERVPMGALVAVIQTGLAPYARVYIPASSRLKFMIGQQASVHVDGVDPPFQGIVRWIATDPAFTPYYALTEDERSRLMYLAEIELPDSAQYLPAGIPAQVDLTK
ncbi:MAG: HlyD family secretion protein [Psychromonas sp.]|jgi:HlyD family secretion protein|uniref:HlyD family secretion protein n=1 Tax=Psychromonas sp. TaxID=1884585 RepID=UPI0039E63DA7